MPTYDYRCRDCGHTIEIIHSILEDGPELCERCRGPMQRVLHPAGVIFRGGGFYVTDSRSSEAKGTGESAGESPGGTAKSGSSDGSGGAPATGSDSGSGAKD
ncbi:MAG: FmdB family zinc ribbon protein [Candidatus Limnocylindria bacterium]